MPARLLAQAAASALPARTGAASTAAFLLGRAAVTAPLPPRAAASAAAPAAAARRRLLACSAAPQSSSSNALPPPPDLAELARMAHVGVTPQEAADWQPKVAGIVEWFGLLVEADAAAAAAGGPAAAAAAAGGAAPAAGSSGNAHLRAGDAPSPSPPEMLRELMAALPQGALAEGGLVRVPRPGAGGGGAGGGGGGAGAASAAAGAPASPPAAAAAPADAAGAGAAAAALANAEALLEALDIRVGRVVSAEPHPEADGLYVESVDVGDGGGGGGDGGGGGARTIVSGLAKYVPIDELRGSLVVVLCNLKPRALRGIKSHGMLLAASDAEHAAVEPLRPPPGARAGERVWFGAAGDRGPPDDRPRPLEPNGVAKKKAWENVAPFLRTGSGTGSGNGNGGGGGGGPVARFAGARVMMTSAGPVTAKSLADARVA